MKPATVKFEGKEEAAEELSYDTIKEGWSEYALEDGTVIKMKNVVSRVFRLLRKTKPDGTPIFILEGSAVVAAINPNSVVMAQDPVPQQVKGN